MPDNGYVITYYQFVLSSAWEIRNEGMYELFPTFYIPSNLQDSQTIGLVLMLMAAFYISLNLQDSQTQTSNSSREVLTELNV